MHCHPLLDTDEFGSFQSTIAQSLADAVEAVAAAVAEILPSMSREVKVAVDAVTAASASAALDVEQRLSRRIDAVAATTRAHNDKRFDALMEMAAPMATELRELRREAVALQQGVGALGPAGESCFAATAAAGAPWRKRPGHRLL